MKYPWVVDHIASGQFAGSFETPEEAYGYADDLSRFSTKDPSSKDKRLAVQQIGKRGSSIRKWAAEVSRAHSYIPFREWLAARGLTWSPRARKWRRA